MTQLSELITNFEARWPIETAEDWDRPGLMVGSPTQTITRALLTVEVTSEVLQEALDLKANLVFSHHPMFLRGVHDLAETGFRGSLAASAIRSGMSVYSAHTNADGVVGGVTDSLAKSFGLQEIQPLSSLSNIGRVGVLPQAATLVDFARLVAKKIPATASGVRVAGMAQMAISRVAVLGGAGDSYLSAVRELDVDVYVTSDLRHHPAQDFMQQSLLEQGRPALIDISHWAAEWVWLDGLAKSLSEDFADVEFVVSEIRTDPWDFSVMQ